MTGHLMAVLLRRPGPVTLKKKEEKNHGIR